MIPRADLVLGACAEELRALAGRLDSAYDAASLRMMAILLVAAAEDSDSAAARLIEENVALRALLARHRTFAVGAEFDELVSATDSDLRITGLTAANDALREALSALHAAVELMEGPAARAVEAEIWDELRRSTVRRHLSTDKFF